MSVTTAKVGSAKGYKAVPHIKRPVKGKSQSRKKGVGLSQIVIDGKVYRKWPGTEGMYYWTDGKEMKIVNVDRGSKDWKIQLKCSNHPFLQRL